MPVLSVAIPLRERMRVAWSCGPSSLCRRRSSMVVIVIIAVLTREEYARAVCRPKPACCSEAIPESTTGAAPGKTGPCSSSHLAVPG